MNKLFSALAALCLATGAQANVQNMDAADAAPLMPAPPQLPNPFVHLNVSGGWTKFKFGAANTSVYSHFLIHNEHPAVLKITDYYCSGDRFMVFDNGRFIGNTSHALFDNCTTTTCDPDHAYYHEEWSHFTYALHAGPHNITLRVIDSPYHEGYAAIRVDPNYMKCCLSLHGLTLIDTRVPYSSAEHACRAHGMELADVDVYNFNDATKVVFGCGGAFSSAYIKSYWGNSYHHSCLALYTGSAAPGGAISTPVSCHEKMPVLCQGKTHSCHHQFLRA